MTARTAGFTRHKDESLLIVDHDGGRYSAQYDLVTKTGYVEGYRFPDNLPKVRIAIENAEDMDDYMAIVKKMRVMYSQNRPIPRDDSFYAGREFGGFQYQKTGNTLKINLKRLDDFQIKFEVDTKTGYFQGPNDDYPGTGEPQFRRIAITSFQDLRSLLKLLELMKGMFSQNRPHERPDSFYNDPDGPDHH